MIDRIVIDGSHGEGGGQVLRTALSLAALMHQPVEIHNIRANRKKPGLRPQHLTAVRSLTEITEGEVAGDRVNSTSLCFSPGNIVGGTYRFNIGTAGSVTLLLAAVLPPLLFASTPSSIVITGGTHVPFSPVFHWMDEILLPFLRRMGVRAEAYLKQWGWYPKGGGECSIQIAPAGGLHSIHIPRRGKLLNLELLLGLAGLPLHIIEREEKYVKKRLEKRGVALIKRFEAAPSTDQGNVLLLKGEYEESIAGFSALGLKGKPGEQVAEEVCRDWLHFDRGNGTVDKHLADQILIYAALATGRSYFISEAITSHLRTNIEIIERFLPVRFEVDPKDCSVSVQGAAYSGLK